MEDTSATNMEDIVETAMQETFKRMLANHDKGMKQQMAEQSIKQAAKLKALKKAQMALRSLLTHKNMSLPLLQDYIISTYFTPMTKPSEILFDGKPENWPTFINHLKSETQKIQPYYGAKTS
jgi:hypothetical protein